MKATNRMGSKAAEYASGAPKKRVVKRDSIAKASETQLPAPEEERVGQQ